MAEWSTEWNLFIDRDVLILGDNWYDVCLKAIDKFGTTAGWITCMTNRIGCHWQKEDSDQNNDDIRYHLKKAKELSIKNKDMYFEPENYAPFSGHFILTNKTAWKDVGGFQQGWGCDNDYDIKLRDKKYKRIVMKELYVYHMYSIKGLWNDI
jgi:GT2 family glycosyltransferase